MPSARKRRLRKLIKGHINRIDAAGDVVNATASAVKSASVVMNEKTEAELITALSISADGKTSDIDADDATQANDFLPRDARESKDTDGDNIGDNRDILLTKLAIDTIYKSRFDGAPVSPATGTLQVEFSSIASQNVALDAALALGGEAAKTQLGVLQASASGSSYTIVGQNSLRTSIQGKEGSVEALKLEISAMTATAGVTIDDAPFYNEVPYKDAGGSVKAFADAAATDVATPIISSETLIDENRATIDSINDL
jgi:hypothetical protein